ncbi:uncharacterized protein LOC132723404 [Ruditapes philippinarum]|uniref:uncharacterized protein LOC132723404 n=1 Tax=Ruditapes philippinarum TaxID=129788 RepID=UPI00295BA82F|nr:uncharacterized protein LOC132723404 [Ruditapes philippinarum]
MEFLILNLFLLAIFCQLNSVVGGSRHDDPYDKSGEDPNDLADHCIHIRKDHTTRLTDYLICPFGCCGSLDDQKCCDDPEKEKHEEEGNKHLVRGLLIFAAVMLIVALSCCVFGVYKHKKAKLRRTSPEKIYAAQTPVQRTSPNTRPIVYYTAKSGMKLDNDETKKTRPERNTQPETSAAIPPTHDTTAPPKYSENASADSNLPPYLGHTPPPPYSFGKPPVAPNSTNFP